MRTDKWGCVLAFDTDHPEFARGVEVGMLFERLQTTELEVVRDETIHDKNVGMVEQMAERFGFNVVVEAVKAEGVPPGYSSATFFRKRPVAAG